MKKLTGIEVTSVSVVPADQLVDPATTFKVVVRPPDMTGPFQRKAWQSRAGREGSGRLDIWVLECPHAHTAYTQWFASVCSLADIDGVEPAKRLYPEAEYELMVTAMQSGERVDIDGGIWPIMMPLDLVFQFHGVGDTGAKRLLNSYVRAVIERGVLSPDSDFRPRWMEWCRDQIKIIRSAEAAH